MKKCPLISNSGSPWIALVEVDDIVGALATRDWGMFYIVAAVLQAS